MCGGTLFQHGCVMLCKSGELNVLGAPLSVFISAFICHISLAFISQDRLHTTLELIIVYMGLVCTSQSPPPECIHARSHRRVSNPTHKHTPSSRCRPTSGRRLSCTLVAMAKWFAPLAAKEAESMMGNGRETI